MIILAVDDALLSDYGELISFTMNIAKSSKDKTLKERIFTYMEKHIDRFNMEMRKTYL